MKFDTIRFGSGLMASAIAALCVQPAMAAGFYLPEVGSPASLGTAGVANPTNTFHADAAWTNPAGMTGLERDSMMAGLQIIAPTLEFARRLSDRGTHMWVRYVLVPGLTDEPDNIAAVADVVATLRSVDRVEISPYHEFGEQKYAALGWSYPLEGVEPPSKAQVKAAGDVFRARGLLVM